MPRKKWFKLLKGRVGTFHLVRYLPFKLDGIGFKWKRKASSCLRAAHLSIWASASYDCSHPHTTASSTVQCPAGLGQTIRRHLLAGVGLWGCGKHGGGGGGERLPFGVGTVEARGRLEFPPQLELDVLTKWQNTHACLLSPKLGGCCYGKRHAGALEHLPNSKLKTPLSSRGHCRESGAGMDAWEQGGCQIIWHSHGAPPAHLPCANVRPWGMTAGYGILTPWWLPLQLLLQMWKLSVVNQQGLWHLEWIWEPENGPFSLSVNWTSRNSLL